MIGSRDFQPPLAAGATRSSTDGCRTRRLGSYRDGSFSVGCVAPCCPPSAVAEASAASGCCCVRSIGEYPRFWLTLLAISHLTWVGVEGPLRRLLLRAMRVHRERPAARQGGRWRLPALEAAVVALLLGTSLGHHRQERPGLDWSALVTRTPEALRGRSFGPAFRLAGADFESRQQGLELRLAWESRTASRLGYWVAVHLIDAQGRIMGQADFAQSLFASEVAQGERWHNRVLLEPPPGAVAVGLALFRTDETPLPIDGGPRDWEGRRLRIPLPGV